MTNRRRARFNLERLAVDCLTSAAIALAHDIRIDQDFNFARCGQVAVLMAKQIRLSCAAETADLAILAETIVSEPDEVAN